MGNRKDLPTVRVGDAHIEVNTRSARPGEAQTYATLVLKDVLHCPDAIADIVGYQARRSFWINPERTCLMTDVTGVEYILD